jgi:hypothetical protein
MICCYFNEASFAKFLQYHVKKDYYLLKCNLLK